MKRIFILEDDPARIDAFNFAINGGTDVTIAKWVHGKGGAIEKWNPPYDLVLLDHDLGGQVYVDSDEAETGFSFVKWLGEKSADLDAEVPFIIIHSWNPEGAKAMMRLLGENNWLCVRHSFDANLLQWVQNYARKTT